MNNKLEPFVKSEGYCCLWAWLEANKRVYTSVLYKQIAHLMTERALRQRRAAYRKGIVKCEGIKVCLRKRIQEGHTIVLLPRKLPDTSAE